MITVIIIAISLSMDAFSLSLAYGTLNLLKKDILLQSIIVGLYHFFMPYLGQILGNKILEIIPINSNFLVFIVLFIIGIQMIVETFKKEENVKKMTLKEMFLFGFTVSIDSLSLGIGLESIYKNIFLASLVFMITSFLFTYIGLDLGKKINEIIGKISTIIGGIILLLVGLFYLI